MRKPSDAAMKRLLAQPSPPDSILPSNGPLHISTSSPNQSQLPKQHNFTLIPAALRSEHKYFLHLFRDPLPGVSPHSFLARQPKPFPKFTRLAQTFDSRSQTFRVSRRHK